MILEKTYIQEQDLATSEQLLEQCSKNRKNNQSLIRHPELWAEVDSRANTMCDLEDRIAYLRQLANIEKANAARWRE